MTTLLAFALLTGLGESAAAAQDECVLRACVEECVPRERWRREVSWEAERQGFPVESPQAWWMIGDEGYRMLVSDHLTQHLRRQWEPEERLWLATQGRAGKQPSAAMRVNLADCVRTIWAEMPNAVSGD